MSRPTMALIAAAAAAIAATAVVALPAIGDSGTTGASQNPDGAHFAACLARHGLPGAPTADLQLKPWLLGKESQDPRTVRAATDACRPRGDGAAAAGPDAASLIACLHSHGLNAPKAPSAFKRWVAEQRQASRSKALDDALNACRMAPAPRDSAPPTAKRKTQGATKTN